MKFTATILTTILLLVFTATQAQTNPLFKKQINQNVKTINSLKTLEQRSVEELHSSVNDTARDLRLTGFFKKDKLLKIVSKEKTSSGIQVMEYYLNNDKLIFVLEQFKTFVFDKKTDSFNKDSTETNFEGKYYFNNNKLIDQITTGHNKFENDNLDPEKVLIGEAEGYIKTLKRKN